MNISSVVTTLESLFIQRRLFELILRWFYNNEMEKTPTSPSLPNLVQILQGMGFQLYGVRKRKIPSQDDKEEKSSLRVMIECNSSELVAFLEIQNVDCQCPEINNDQIVPVLVPACYKSEDDTKDDEMEPDYSHLFVPVPDDVKKIINPIIHILLVVLEEAFNSNRSNVQRFINLAERTSNPNADLPDSGQQTAEEKEAELKKSIVLAFRENLDLETCLRRDLQKLNIKSTEGGPFFDDFACTLPQDSASSAVHQADTVSAISEKQQKDGSKGQASLPIFRECSVPEDGEDPNVRLPPTTNSNVQLAESLIRMQHDTTRALKILLCNLASQRHCACYPAGCTHVNATSTYAVAGASTEQQRPLISNSAFAYVPKPELCTPSLKALRDSCNMPREMVKHIRIPYGDPAFKILRDELPVSPISLGRLSPPPQFFPISSAESSASTSTHEVQPSSESYSKATTASLHSSSESLDKGSRPTKKRGLPVTKGSSAQSQRTASVSPTLGKTEAKLEKIALPTKRSPGSSGSSSSKSGSKKK